MASQIQWAQSRNMWYTPDDTGQCWLYQDGSMIPYPNAEDMVSGRWGVPVEDSMTTSAHDKIDTSISNPQSAQFTTSGSPAIYTEDMTLRRWEKQSLSFGLKAKMQRVKSRLNALVHTHHTTEPKTEQRTVLKERQFRLLYISPSKDRRKRVECHCALFDLDAAPPYEALSYVWGDSSLTTDISVNGSATAVTTSLADALVRLRLPSSARIIWVDAVCIDQQDSAEKSHQVPLMGRIYSMARRVVVWLGQEDALYSAAAQMTIIFIGGACRQYDLTRNMHPEDRRRYGAIEVPYDIFKPNVLESLKRLYYRSWFTRIWCVQEISLAQEAVVLYGNMEMPWEAVRLTASWTFDKRYRSGGGNAFTSLLSEINPNNADTLRNGNLEGSLLDVLCRSTPFEATDPRDKVYGLLNLVTDKREKEALEVDYDKTRAQVYADTTILMIQLYSRLSTLGFVFHAEDYDGQDELRSWAPDWDENIAVISLGQPESICPWSACGTRIIEALSESHICYEQLQLFGIFYDTVSHVHEVVQIEDLHGSPKPGEHDFVSAIKRALENVDLNPKVNSQEHYRKFARTLTAGTADVRPNGPASDPTAQEIFHSSFMNLMQWLTDASQNMMADPEALDSNAEQIWSDAGITCEERRIFIMKNRSFGLGPRCMRAGDVVVVLHGGNTPYILRPKGDKYLFMGAAYVDEIMYGELVQEVHNGIRSEQEFCIV